MHAFGVAREKGMPCGQGFVGPEQFVGAGLGKPIEIFLDGFGREHDTFGHELVADRVFGALAAFAIQEAASDAGEHDLTGVFIL